MLVQAILYVVITYPMIGLQLSASKTLWAFYAIFCTVMSFNYQGMLIVSAMPKS
uniref:ABC-2 type transporter transmembrane domain-containing protein n=1 Tax=Rhizophora mucronata TaxID=61149 RepID=A0A2P2PUQ3_RHIMU